MIGIGAAGRPGLGGDARAGSPRARRGAMPATALLLAALATSSCGAEARGTVLNAPSTTQAPSGVSSSGAASSPATPASSRGAGRSTSPGELTATFDSLGQARIGTPLAEFARSLGHRVTPVAPGEGVGECWIRAFAGLPGVTAMVSGSKDGTVRRVDVRTTAVRSSTGVGVGSTEDEVRAAYPRAVRTEPNKYVEGALDLRVQSGKHRMIFEVDARHRVTGFRFGEAEEVSWVEGCS